MGSEDAYHSEHPKQPEIGTEVASTLCTRGIYANDKERGYMSAYDDTGPAWGNTAEGVVDRLRGASMALGRICLDRF